MTGPREEMKTAIEIRYATKKFGSKNAKASVIVIKTKQRGANPNQ